MCEETNRVIREGQTVHRPKEKLPRSEELEDTKGEMRIRRTDNTMAKRKSTKGQTTINKTYIQN
jgi:hypothetical protein